MKKIRNFFIAILIMIIILIPGYLLLEHRLDTGVHNPILVISPIPVKYFEGEISLDAKDSVWNSIEPISIHLFPQSARVPHGTTERDIKVKAFYNNQEIAFEIEFQDSTQDLGSPVNPDACAIMFIKGNSPATAQMMGYADTANIWHWSADRNLEHYEKGNTMLKPIRSLIATGPGTQTPLKIQRVDGKGIYENYKWSVVIKGYLYSHQAGEFEIKPSSKFSVAFALWDGHKMESFARKSISIVQPLIFKSQNSSAQSREVQ